MFKKNEKDLTQEKAIFVEQKLDKAETKKVQSEPAKFYVKEVSSGLDLLLGENKLVEVKSDFDGRVMVIASAYPSLAITETQNVKLKLFKNNELVEVLDSVTVGQSNINKGVVSGLSFKGFTTLEVKKGDVISTSINGSFEKKVTREPAKLEVFSI